MAATATRKRKAAKKPKIGPLYDPAAFLSGKQLKAAATGATNAVIKPQVGAIGRELGSVSKQGKALVGNAQSYYRDLAAKEAAAVARQAAIGQLAQDRQDRSSAGTDQAMQNIITQAQAGQAADHALRGGGLEGGNASASADATINVAERNAAYRVADADRIHETTQDYQGLQDAMRSARELRGGEVSQQLLNRVANQQTQLRGKLADVRASRGDVYLKNLLQLRQQGFENRATMKGLGLKNLDLQMTAEQKAADRAAAKERARIQAATTRRGQTLSHQDRVSAAQQKAAKDAAKARGKDVASIHAATDKAWGTIDTWLSKVNSGLMVPSNPADPHSPPRHATLDETKRQLRAEGLPEWQVEAVIALRHHGGRLTPAVVDMIHRAAPNVRIPSRYRPRRARRPRPGAVTAPGGSLGGSRPG